MRIIVIHNTYQQRGGEDAVVEAELAMLSEHGHEVEEYRRHNDEIACLPFLKTAVDTLWSRQTVTDLVELITRVRPDIIHSHNTFPLISPSLYWVSSRLQVPVVQTLHNFRLICPQAMFLRDDLVCEDCSGRLPWPGVLHKCYRDSMTQTTLLFGMLALHRALGTYFSKVKRFIALTEFSKNKFIEAGFPAGKLCVKPNFSVSRKVPHQEVVARERPVALFVGRISPEKGVRTLVKAWRYIDFPLKIVGDGPLFAEIKACSAENINCLGQLREEQVSAEMSNAAFLVMPSEWYETFGLVLIEAFAHGLPIVASRLGAMKEIVEEGVTGLLFEPGNVEDLVAKVCWMNEHPDECRQMGHNARGEFERNYTAERNYEMLMNIYQEAING